MSKIMNSCDLIAHKHTSAQQNSHHRSSLRFGLMVSPRFPHSPGSLRGCWAARAASS